jgi:hypothetical protein
MYTRIKGRFASRAKMVRLPDMSGKSGENTESSFGKEQF